MIVLVWLMFRRAAAFDPGRGVMALAIIKIQLQAHAVAGHKPPRRFKQHQMIITRHKRREPVRRDRQAAQFFHRHPVILDDTAMNLDAGKVRA